MRERSPLYLKMQEVPKPVIYLLLVGVLVIPLVRPLQLPLASSANTQRAYALVDSLSEGAYVFHTVTVLPAVDAELWPQMLTLSRHYMEKGLRVIYWNHSQEGLQYSLRILEEVAPAYGYEYGVDFAVLPFKAGGETAVASLKDFRKTFPRDAFGTPIGELPLFDAFLDMGDAALWVVNTGGDDVSHFVRHVEPEYGVPIVAAGTAPVLPAITPYLGSGQVKGAVVGTAGAAEYEALTGVLGSATSAMDAQQMGHLFIIFMVILGNAGYLIERSRSTRDRKRGGLRG